MTKLQIALIVLTVWLPLVLLAVAFIHGANRKPSPTKSDGAADTGPAA